MNAPTRRIDNRKNFEKELNLIEKFNSFNELDVSLIGYENTQAQLSKNERKITLALNARVGDKIEQLSFVIDDVIYEARKLNYASSSADFNENSPAKFSTTYEINTLQIQGFREKGCFMTFYPVELKEIKTFHTEFETVTHQRNGTEYFYDCLRISINGKSYDVTQLKTPSKGFYVFECLEEESFENYLEACFSIRQAIGFINRLMVGDEEYVFDDSGNMYYSNYIRPAIKGMYSPITTNPYSYPDIDRKFADKLFEQLTRISLENLSNLATKILTDQDFSAAILVLLEASSIRSLLLIPSSFAVIIELLAKNLSIEEDGLETPITDKELKEKIIEELHNVIDRNEHSLSSEAILKLKRRLSEVNRPINKQHLTNDEKLTRPFKQLNIHLSTQDIAIIEHRNDLLHGNILLKNKNDQSIGDTDLYMAYVSAKLFTLISKLILKSIGYNGYIYNQAKYLEKHMKINTTEHYFEKI